MQQKLLNSLGVLLGLAGTFILSGGNAGLAQLLYCFSNPLLLICSYKSGCKQTAGLFLIYWLLAIRGAFL